MLCRGDVVVLNEGDLQATVHVRIVVDLVRDSVDELNDGLRANVAWGGLGTEDEHARWHVQRWVFLDAVVEIQDVERVEKLALVLVQTLNLGIEDGVRVHRNTLAVLQPGGEVLLVLVLDVENLTQHGLVVSKLFELSELVQVGDPGVRTRQASQQCRQARVALVEPAARGDSVGLVVEALRPDIVPVLQRFALNDFRVQGSHTVDGVRGVAGDPRHVDAAVGNRRHVVNLALVEAALRQVFAEAAVNLTGDLQNAAEETVKNGVFPGLQRFCQNGVVGVGEGVGHDVPGVVPAHIVLIQEQTHQLWDREHRVGVIELNGVVLVEIAQVLAVILDVRINHRLQRSRDEEVLLANAQDLAVISRVIRVEHAAQVMDALPFDNGVGETLRVEGVIVELTHWLRVPQAQRADVIGAVAGNWHVIWNSAHDQVIKGDNLGEFLATNDEGVALFHPRIRVLILEAIFEGLLEQAVAVEDAITGHRQILRGTGIQEAGGQTTQATVTESGVVFSLEHVCQILAVLFHGSRGLIHQTCIEQVIQQGATHEELGGEVVLLAGSSVCLRGALPVVR